MPDEHWRSRSRAAEPTSQMLRVEDLFFLDDLRSLVIPWIDSLVQDCTTHEDVERLWNVIRCWGPDHEEVRDMASNSETSSLFKTQAAKLREMLRLIESWKPQSS